MQAPRSLITLGLLVDRLDDNYSSSLAFAFREEVASRGLRGICFVGHERDANRKDPSNLAYELAGPRALDGLIIGTLGSTRSVEAEQQFLERYRGLPRCTYSISISGVPRVAVDHRAGMKAAVGHLIAEHGHRRIAFIRGPQTSLDAELRYKGYRSALTEAGLGVDEILISQGAFTAASAVEAISVLLDERKLGFDALVAANDAMASGALRALESRGIRVPRDVAVVGFDDDEDSRFARPPISSVRHPWRAQSSLAFDLILAQLAGKEITESPAVASDFVARASCGCGVSSTVSRTVRDSMLPPVVDERDWLSGWAFSLLRNLGSRQIDLDQAVAGQLVFAFWGQVSCGEGNFLALLEEELSKELNQPASVAAWYTGISDLKQDVLSRVGERKSLKLATHNLTHAAFQCVSYAAERQQALRRFRVEQQGRWLALAGERTINAFEPERVALALREPLRGMGIPSCYVARFIDEETKGNSLVNLVIACEAEQQYLKVINEPFAAAEILPQDMWPQRAGCVLVLEILQFRGVSLGYALFELGPRHGAVYRGLAERLAAALKGADLAREAAAQAKLRQAQELLRIEGELRIAREVQRWILPPAVRSEVVDVAAEISSGQGSKAAYYDLLVVGNSTWLCLGSIQSRAGNSGLMVPVLQSVVASLCAVRRGASAKATHRLAMDFLRDSSRPQGQAIHSVSLLLARCDANGEVEIAGECSGCVYVVGAERLIDLAPRASSLDASSRPLEIDFTLREDDSLVLSTLSLGNELGTISLAGDNCPARDILQAVVASSEPEVFGVQEGSLIVAKYLNAVSDRRLEE